MSTSTGSAFDPQQALSQHVLKNFYIGGDWVKPQSDQKLDSDLAGHGRMFSEFAGSLHTRMSIGR